MFAFTVIHRMVDGSGFVGHDIVVESMSKPDAIETAMYQTRQYLAHIGFNHDEFELASLTQIGIDRLLESTCDFAIYC